MHNRRVMGAPRWKTKMTKRTIIAAVALVSLSFWAAYSFDSFGTMVLSLPAFLLFLTVALNAIVKAVKLKNTKELKPLLIATVGFALLFSAFKMSDHGLASLTKERERKMVELRPIIMKYKEERGEYPKSLDLLVPRYISKLPDILGASSENGDSYKRLTYDLENGKPVFRYRVMRGPDSGAMFDVESGKISRDM